MAANLPGQTNGGGRNATDGRRMSADKVGKHKGVIATMKERAAAHGAAEAAKAELSRAALALTSTAQGMLRIGMMQLYALPNDDARGLHPLMVDVGVLLIECGRVEEAEPLLREALDVRRTRLGSDHESTLQALDSLAMSLKALGKLDEAQALFTEAIATRKAIGGEQPSPQLQTETLTSINNLGTLLRSQGKHEEAIIMLNEALAGRRELLGPEDPDTIVTSNNLAFVYMLRKRFEEAEELAAETVRIALKVLGADHANTRTYVNNLSALRKLRRAAKEAKEAKENAKASSPKRQDKDVNRWQKAVKGNSQFKDLVAQLNGP